MQKINALRPDGYRGTRVVGRVILRTSAFICVACIRAVRADPGDVNAIEFYLNEQLVYDDNLYRLPVYFTDLKSLIGPNASRTDEINIATVGADGHWTLGRQTVTLSVHFDDNRFFHNQMLNNIAFGGRLAWNWQLGPRLLGDVGTSSSRSLVSFADNRIFTKDLVDNRDTFADGRYQIGVHWIVTGGAHHTESLQSAAAERVNNLRSTTQTVGLEYQSSSGNTLDLTYAFAEATLPQGLLVAGVPFDRDYKDNNVGLRVNYAPTAKTTLQASASYLKRDYPNATIGDFSGDTWRASLDYRPDVQTQITAAAWRDLTAYVDAQSNYFVTTGASITPSWMPTDKFTASVGLNWERQRFIGSDPSPLANPLRRDTVESAQVQAVYSPVRLFDFTASYRRERRQSNRPVYEYYDGLASLGVRLKF